MKPEAKWVEIFLAELKICWYMQVVFELTVYKGNGLSNKQVNINPKCLVSVKIEG